MTVGHREPRGSRSRRAIAALVVGFALLGTALFGCSSHSALGDRYLAVMAPVNAATTTFQRAVGALGKDPTASEVEKAADPFAAAIERGDTKLLAAQWPHTVQQDVARLVTANRELVVVLRSAATPNFSPSRWFSDVHAGEAATLRASNAVRQDVGLTTATS